MRHSNIARALLLFVSNSMVSLSQSLDPPSLTPLFTVQVGFGRVPAPIPIATGGLQLIEPLTGGNITGPAFNGIFAPGVAYPTLDTASTVQFPQIILYGTAADNTTIDFLAQIEGVGAPNDQWARVQLTIGGKYSYLQDQYILGHIQANRQAGTVTIPAWCVGCSQEVISKIATGAS